MLYFIREDRENVRLTERPTGDFAWQSSPVKLRSSGVEVVACSVPPVTDGFKPVPPLTRYNVPWMKSCLQKAVRRMKSDTAVRMANTMLAQNPGELLRRLPVIVIEDSFLHPLYPVLVWLMMAHSKGYALSEQDATLVLSVVRQVSDGRYRDSLFKGDRYREFCTVSPDDNVFVSSLVIRADYGGMPGDLKMLRISAGIWKTRYEKNDRWLTVARDVYADVPATNESIGYILPEDYLPEGADFHCFPSMVWTIRKRSAVTLSDVEIKKAVWYYRSGVNHKTLIVDPKDCLALDWSGFEDATFEMGRKTFERAWKSIREVIETVSAEVSQYTEPQSGANKRRKSGTITQYVIKRQNTNETVRKDMFLCGSK